MNLEEPRNQLIKEYMGKYVHFTPQKIADKNPEPIFDSGLVFYLISSI